MEQLGPLTTGRNSSLRASDGFKTVGVALDSYQKRYLLKEKIESGGIGTVFKAESEDGGIVAIKVLNPGADQWFQESFKREAEILASVDSEAVVKFISYARATVGPISTDFAYVMEFIEGRPLSLKKLGSRRHNLENWRTWISFSCKLLRGLNEIHKSGHIHGDVKWENVFESGKLIDPLPWPIGSILYREENGVRYIPGSLQYMAPERFNFSEVGPQTDSYSIGVMLYSLFGTLDPLNRKLTQPIPCLLWHSREYGHSEKPRLLSQRESLGYKFPKGLDDAIGKLLEPDPRKRYGPQEFLNAMDILYSIF